MNTLNLTAAQQLAAESREPVTYVVAGPGSGKTHTLVSRIVTAIRDGVQPQEIMALTFTNSAAHEFTERLAAAGVFGLGFCGTIHGFCFRLLQQHGDKIGYRAGRITIITEDQRAALVAAAIARAKPKMSQKEFKAGETPEAKQARNEYLHTLKMNNAVHYDNILTAAKVLLLMNEIPPMPEWLMNANAGDTVTAPPMGAPEPRVPVIKSSLKLLCVDEAQDQNQVEWDIIDLIKAEMKWIVGDPDQSLFAFKGAKPMLLVERAHAFEAKTVLLEENFRSGQNICEAANRLIAHNTNRVEKLILPARPAYSEVVECRSKDEREEVDRIRGILQSGWKMEECAVLSRNNDVANRLRDGLRTAGLPVREPAAETLPADWPRCVAALAFLHDPANELAAMTWLLMDHDPGTVEAWQREAHASKRPLVETAGAMPPQWNAEPGLDEVREMLESMRVSEDSIATVESRARTLPDNSTLSDLLQDLWNVRTWARPMRGEGITVTTIHQSKGLEFDCVVVAGCEETRLPGRGNLEEERRIFFVAMTRARRFLCLSSCRMRPGFGGKEEFLFTSRFVEECGL